MRLARWIFLWYCPALVVQITYCSLDICSVYWSNLRQSVLFLAQYTETLPRGNDVNAKLPAVSMNSMKRVARLSIQALLAALLLMLATPSSSRLAIEQPHVGLGAFLAERDHVYLVDNMKFDWAVWQLQWSLAEPSKGNYQWLGLDELLAYAQSEGVMVVLRVDSAPAWARSGPEGAPPDDMDDFGDFMSAVASRAAGQVAGYVIWNEPNLPMNWGGSPNAGQYVRMLQAVYPRIKAADSDAAVVTSGMATTGGPGGALCDLGGSWPGFSWRLTPSNSTLPAWSTIWISSAGSIAAGASHTSMS